MFLSQFHTFGGLDRQDLYSLQELIGDQNKNYLLVWIKDSSLPVIFIAKYKICRTLI